MGKRLYHCLRSFPARVSQLKYGKLSWKQCADYEVEIPGRMEGKVGNRCKLRRANRAAGGCSMYSSRLDHTIQSYDSKGCSSCSSKSKAKEGLRT